MKKADLRNFAKFTRKHLCQSLHFNKVGGLRAEICNFIEKETLAQVLSSEFCGIFQNTFFTEHDQETASVDSLAYLDNKFNDYFNLILLRETLQWIVLRRRMIRFVGS